MLGPRISLDPQRHNFNLGIPTCWYLKMLKFALPPMLMLKFALPPTPTPYTSRWNIGGIGSQTRGAGIGHVDFILFVSISFALGSQRKPSFKWNMGFRSHCIISTSGLHKCFSYTTTCSVSDIQQYPGKLMLRYVYT